MPQPLSQVYLNSAAITRLLNRRHGTTFHYRDIHARLSYTQSCPVTPRRDVRMYKGRPACLIAASDFPALAAWVLDKPVSSIPPLTADELASVGAVPSPPASRPAPLPPEGAPAGS